MRPELRDEAVQTLGAVAEQAGYERGLRAALEAGIRARDKDKTGMLDCSALIFEAIERLLEQTKGGDDEH